MSKTRSDSINITVNDGDWKKPPPGTRWRMAHVLLLKESDGISAVVLNLPGCASQGDTLEEAMENVREALRGCLDSYSESNQPVPWRNSRQDSIPPFSEQRYIKVEEKIK